MRLIAIAVVATLTTACTYGPGSGVYREVNYNYPPVGYVLTAQPASASVCPKGTQAVYQTFWTYDPQGRFNPTQQYVCAPGTGGRKPGNPRSGYPVE